MPQDNPLLMPVPIENVLLAEYDAESAENEVLANIRRAFFSYGGIKRKKDITCDKQNGEMLYASFVMTNDEPLSLHVKRGKKTVMRSQKLKKGSYAVDFFDDNGRLKKRCVFSCEHDFTEILYYDGTKNNTLLYTLTFGYNDGERVVTVIKDGKEDEKLFAFKAPDGFEPQQLAEQAEVSFPLTLIYSNKTEFYATRKDIDLMLDQADKLRREMCFVPSDTGFGFTPQDFASEEKSELPKEDIPEETSKISKPVNEFAYTEEDNEPVLGDLSKEKPDCVINSANEKYLYYGGIDENGDRSGLGRTTLKNGMLTYYGNYSGDKRVGFGSYYYKSGKPCYFGNWKDNKRDGMGIGFRSSDGEIHAGNWRNNKPDGIGVRFDENGTVKYIADFRDGQRNGLSLSFDGDGNLIITKFKDGEQLADKRVIDLNDFRGDG